jgi:hypothetical protein
LRISVSSWATTEDDVEHCVGHGAAGLKKRELISRKGAKGPQRTQR